MRRIFLALSLILALAAASPSTPAADKTELTAKYEGKSFVLQHNLHVQDNSAKWQNFIEGDFVPLGSKVTVKLTLEDAIPDATVVLDHILGVAARSLKGFGKKDLDGIKDSAVNHDLKASKLTYMKATYDFCGIEFAGDKVAAIED